MWYVYFLELSNGHIYVGSTNDLRRRVGSHQRGHVQSVPIRLTHTPTTYRFRGVNRRVAYGRSRPHRIGIPAIAS